MECALYYVEKDDLEKMKTNLKVQDPGLFFAEIQGANIQSRQEFYDAAGVALKFPTPVFNSAAYLDWMCDLMWLTDATGYVFVVNQFSLMLLKNLPTKVSLMNYFRRVVFPWWDGEIEKYQVGGKKKPFIVYLVEEELADMGESLPVPPNTPSA